MVLISKLLLIFIFSVASVWAEKQNLVGSFKFLPQKEKELGASEFFLFTHKGQNLALPVEFKSKEQKNLAKNTPNTNFIVNAEILTMILKLDGAQKEMKLLKISELRKIDLKDFSLQPLSGFKKGFKVGDQATILDSKTGSELGLSDVNGKLEIGANAVRNRSGQVTIKGVNDKLTNAMIGVGAAYMLFEIVKN